MKYESVANRTWEKVIRPLMDEYAKDKNFTVKYSSSYTNSTSDDKPSARLVVKCSRSGKPPPKKPKVTAKTRNRASLRCGCSFYVRFLQDKSTKIWEVTRSMMLHKEPCTPSVAQADLVNKKRGQKISHSILEKLCSSLCMNPSTKQLRDWVNANNVRINTDSKSLRNLLIRARWYDMVC